VGRMRSSGGGDGPVSVADLLDRNGRVLRDGRADPKGDPAGGDRSRTPLPGRWRRTLIAVGCVVAAGSVLSGAFAVGDAGHDEPLGPRPGGLLDQLTRGPGAADPYGAPGGYPGAELTGDDLVDTTGHDAAGPRVPQPRPPAPGAAAASPGPAGVPLPRQPAGAPVAGPAAPGGRSPAPAAAPPIAVVPAPAPAADRGAAPAPAPAPAPSAGSGSARSASTGDAAGGAEQPAQAPPAPAPAPGADGSGGGVVGGVVGGVTDTVGGLLGG
jgi:hypothetical protein